ncbi:MAG TPA: 50S ribosomal protein L23 [Gammaproteobacteria bacterium]|nr:50S ribosomal protein L23 [Gammaproteobacteria bacterium]
MNQAKLMDVLLAPHVSEKATLVGDAHNQNVFKVRRDASKTDISKAIELMFDVKVQSVSTVNVRGKQKRFGGRRGRQGDWKKAYVTLAPGSEINLLAGE